MSDRTVRVARGAPPVTLFTREQADLLVPRRAFAPLRDFLVGWQEALAAELEQRLWGFGFTRLAENLDNFGLFFMRSDAPAPQLWFGIGWGTDDAPGTLPSWGASLQVEGEWVRDWRSGAGGLRTAMDHAARDSAERLGLYTFDEHVELAEWRSFEWLLEERDQGRALVGYWGAYLDLLARAEVAEAIDGYVSDTFGY